MNSRDLYWNTNGGKCVMCKADGYAIFKKTNEELCLRCVSINEEARKKK